MDVLARLLAIDDIKRLKAKYFFFLDHKDWAGWKQEVFTPDASFHVPDAQREPVVGIDAIIEWVSLRAGQQVSVHHGHMPIIDNLAPDSDRPPSSGPV
jgi:hypothetical protein